MNKHSIILSAHFLRRINFIHTDILLVFMTVFAVLPVNTSAYGQTDDAIVRRFVFAQQIEKQGYPEEALAIYKEIYSLHPDNQTYFFKVRRTLENLKRYEEWLEYLAVAIQANPRNKNLLGERARAFFLSGKEGEAKQDWTQIIELNPGDESSYRFVSQLQQGSRLYDEAVGTLHLGRENLGDPEAFASELANIYFYRQEYINASLEYITMVTVNPAFLTIAEQRINSFPADSSVVAAVTYELESVSEDSLNGPLFRKLLSGYYIKNKEYRKALDSYITLDSVLASEGTQILNYADQVFAVGAYSYSEEAYSHFRDLYPDSDQNGRAHFGVARSIENAALDEHSPADQEFSTNKHIRKRDLQEALDEYSSITQLFPNTKHALDAFYRIGDISFHYFFDVDRAIEAYNSARKISPQSETGLKATINIGDCYLASGDRKQATFYYALLNHAQENMIELKNAADFKTIQTDYYGSETENVLKRLENLFDKTSRTSDLSNDILDLILIIEDNKDGDSSAFRSYTQAEFLLKQRKFSEAELLLQEIISESSSFAIADDSVYKIAEIQRSMGRYDESLNTLHEFQNLFPDSPLSERVSISIAELYSTRLEQPILALSEYESFLLRYTNSIYLDSVRKHIRNLRDQ